MKIGIIGSRGIPNQHGGFEQFAEYLSVGLVDKGCKVWVYTSDSNTFKQTRYKGVNLIHCYDPEKYLGPFGQFVYDLNCILDSRKRKFDIILQLGYTSSAIWNWLFKKNPVLVTNTDGLEWQRNKYNYLVRRFLKYSEKIIVKNSDFLISDSEAIRDYTKTTYRKASVFIPYGAGEFTSPSEKTIQKFALKPHNYFLIIARLQSDNNIETIIKGYKKSDTKYSLFIVGNINNRFARNLKNQYGSDLVRFAGGIYDERLLNNLRFFSAAYFHGHSAGGTNPSLLEAMAAGAFICAHNNKFNREVLGNDAAFFNSPDDVATFINSKINNHNKLKQRKLNLERIKSAYSRQEIVNRYFEFFNQIKKK